MGDFDSVCAGSWKTLRVPVVECLWRVIAEEKDKQKSSGSQALWVTADRWTSRGSIMGRSVGRLNSLSRRVSLSLAREVVRIGSQWYRRVSVDDPKNSFGCSGGRL